MTSHTADVFLQRVTAAGRNNVARQAATIDSHGNLSVVFNLPTGAVVKSGVILCLSGSDVSFGTNLAVDGMVHGYLANDE